MPEQEYDGYGVCPACRGPMGRRRACQCGAGPCQRRCLTLDRCPGCGEEWGRLDTTRRWRRRE